MAFYDFKEKQGIAKDEGDKKLYASIVYNGTISAQKLIKSAARHTTFSEAEMVGALAELMSTAADYIGQGYRVELGEFGFFSGKIKARHVADKKEMRAQSIRFNGVSFRASKQFRTKVAGDLERSPHKQFRKSSKRSPQELQRILMTYLDANGFITRTTYTVLTGRIKNTALTDLQSFVDQGLIERRGRGNQLHFVPRRAATGTPPDTPLEN